MGALLKWEQIFVPVISFLTIFLVHARYFKLWLTPTAWADPHARVDLQSVHNLRTLFVGIRTRWVLENHGRKNMVVQTLRDMIRTCMSSATAAMAFISIFIGLSKSNLLTLNLLGCRPEDGPECNSFDAHLRMIRFGLCIGNFVVIFFNMLLAARFALNTSFMINTKRGWEATLTNADSSRAGSSLLALRTG
ncbi:hypothetical protein Naga_100426g1 [Nannochloropsis gaditana]|uniref:Uncharacterized protein n=1 Tax=Nannochloropsis gaditana TaxID=72520 RepID=W7TUZ8_9STRA|nr:hypothetical protein Naga_100426g1 [Nannochloropsis gaditana]